MVKHPTIVKRYSNRRLYDTGLSRYITLDELATRVQSGTDVRVVDAKTGDDLTQTTLAQLLVEFRGAARMFPLPLLTVLIRLEDDALAEFLGRYVPMALEMYLQNRRNAAAMGAYNNPFTSATFTPNEALARLWMISPLGTSRASHVTPAWPPGPSAEVPPASAPAEPEQPSTEVIAELRREVQELKRSLLQRSEPDAPRPRGKRRRSSGRKPPA